MSTSAEFSVGRVPEEAREKVAYYASRPDEREAIARAGQRHVLREHTFARRCRRHGGGIAERLTRFLATCGLLTPNGQPKGIGKLQLPGAPSSAWAAFQYGLDKRRRQL